MAVKVQQKNIWVVYGEDPVLVQEKKQELLRRYFKGNGPEPAVLGASDSLDAYRTAMEGQSLFSAETAVIIENPSFLKRALRDGDEAAYQKLLQTMKDAGPDVFVVITYEGKPDRRVKPVKSLFSFASSIECTLMKPQDGAEKMEEYLYDHGKRMDREARGYLQTVLAAWAEISQPFLETECDKILLLCGDEKVVTKALLQEALPDYMDQGIFRFTDQLLERNAQAVLEGAPRVFTDTQSTLKNLGFLASQFRRIKMLKEMRRTGASSAVMMKRLGIRGSWQMRNLEAAARKVSEEEAENFLLDLFHFQYEMRLGGSERDMEDLLLRFCLAGKGKAGHGPHLRA